MGIRFRFVLITALFSLLAIQGISLFSYQLRIKSAKTEAKAKGMLIAGLLEASRVHFRTNQSPKIEELLDALPQHKEGIPADLISCFAVTRGVWKKFAERHGGYHFKQAAINPLLPENRADATDLQIINQFQAEPQARSLEGFVNREGRSFYYYAEQIIIVESCLQCHGALHQAPHWQRLRYGTEQGNQWKAGEVAAAHIIYIPMQEIINQARRDTWYLMFTGAGAVFLLVLVIWLFLSVSIIRPMRLLEKRATEISLGKNLNKPIAIHAQDEIGALIRAVERLRISVEKMLNRFQR